MKDMPKDEELIEFITNQTKLQWHVSKKNKSRNVISELLDRDQTEKVSSLLKDRCNHGLIVSKKHQGKFLLKISKKDILKMKNKQDKQKVKGKSQDAGFNVVKKEVAKAEILLAGSERGNANAILSLTRLSMKEGTTKESFGEYLYTNSQFLNKAAVGIMLIQPSILEEYINNFEFKNKDFLTAMDEFFGKFVLPNAEKERSRIIEAFANRYYIQNLMMLSHKIDDFNSLEAIKSLTTAVIELRSSDKIDEKNIKKNFMRHAKPPLTKLLSSSAEEFLEMLYNNTKLDYMINTLDKIRVSHQPKNSKMSKEPDKKPPEEVEKESRKTALVFSVNKEDLDVYLQQQVKLLNKVKQDPEDLAEVLISLKVNMEEIAKNSTLKGDNMINALLKEIEPLIRENEKRIKKQGKLRF